MNVSKCDSPQSHSNGILACKKEVQVRPGKHPCTNCGYQAVSQSCLKTHMSTHSDERNYHCYRCPGKKYKTSAVLNRHIKQVHKERKKYWCKACNVNFSRLESYKRHTKTNKHTHNKTTLPGTETSKKVQHHLPSNLLIASRTDSPEPIKNKTLTYKKSELSGQKDSRKAAKNTATYTEERPEAGGSTQLEKAGALNSEKSSADIELKKALTKIEDLQCEIQNLQEQLTIARLERNTACSLIEKLRSIQTNAAMFRYENVLNSENAYPGLIHLAVSDTNGETSSRNYMGEPVFYQKNTTVSENLDHYSYQLVTPEDLNLYNRCQQPTSEDLSCYSQQVIPEYSDPSEPLDLTKKS